MAMDSITKQLGDAHFKGRRNLYFECLAVYNTFYIVITRKN